MPVSRHWNAAAVRPQERGLALLSVVIVMLLLALIGAAALYLTRSHYELLQDQVRRQRAYYAAEAGLQHGLWLMRTSGQAAFPAIVNVGGIGVNLSVQGCGSGGIGEWCWVSASVTYQ